MTRAGLLTTIVVTGVAVAGAAAQRGPRIPPTGAIMHGQRQPLRDSRRRRQHHGVRDQHGRRARRHQARQQRRSHHEPGEDGHRQAGVDDHQHPHASRSQRQQRLLQGRAADHRGGDAREHEEVGRRQPAVGPGHEAGQDLLGQDDARERQGPDRSLLVRRRAHQRRRLRGVQGAAGDVRRRRHGVEDGAAHRPGDRRQRRSRCPTRSRRRSRASRTWTSSSKATAT